MTDLYGPELQNPHTSARPAIDSRHVQGARTNYRAFGGWPAGTTADQAAGSGLPVQSAKRSSDRIQDQGRTLSNSRLFHEQIIGVTPQPILPGLKRPDNRMGRLVIMLGGMIVLRRVAAADMPTGQVETKMNPD